MKTEELKKTKLYHTWRENPAQYSLNLPRSFCLRFDLSPTELMIFQEIHLYTHFFPKKCFCASRSHLQILVNGSPPTIDKALNKLLDKGFIAKFTEKMPTKIGTERLNICYKSNLPREISIREDAQKVNDQLEKILENHGSRHIAAGIIQGKKTLKDLMK